MDPKKLKSIVLVVLVLGVYLYTQIQERKAEDAGGGTSAEQSPDTGTRERPKPEPREDRPPRTRPTERKPTASGGQIERAFARKQSKVWVEDEGRIVHLLPDDRIAPRHQLCLVELASGHTIKISHNVDLAPKVPWRKGDSLAFRGRFEWNDKGGVVHWTHHDPGGRHEGGWLKHKGREYR